MTTQPEPSAEPSAEPSPGSAPDTDPEPLQAALAAEHAAVFGYGVLGAVLAGADPGDGSDEGADAADAEGLAESGYAAHRERRDELQARLGADAVAAEPAYSLPFRVDTAQQARRLGRVLERRCAAVYADVVSRTSGDLRILAADALAECAVRGLGWGAEPEPFPGLGDLSG